MGVNWNRLIRTDGIDIQIGSPGTDQLGRAGIEGSLDNKFWTRLGTAFLVSYVIPKLARKIENVKDDRLNVTNTNNADGSSVSVRTGVSAKSEDLKESADKFKEITEDAIKKSFSDKPTIHVPQGTRVNILVQKDLIFPSNTAMKNLKSRKQQ